MKVEEDQSTLFTRKGISKALIAIAVRIVRVTSQPFKKFNRDLHALILFDKTIFINYFTIYSLWSWKILFILSDLKNVGGLLRFEAKMIFKIILGKMFPANIWKMYCTIKKYDSSCVLCNINEHGLCAWAIIMEQCLLFF